MNVMVNPGMRLGSRGRVFRPCQLHPTRQRLTVTGFRVEAWCSSGRSDGRLSTGSAGVELGRIAALTQRVRTDRSPLERRVRHATWIIAVVAVVAGVLFLPIGSG